MYECSYTIKTTINGEKHEIVLSHEEIDEIWSFYKDYLLAERIWERFKNDYGVDDYAKFEEVIGCICDSYNSHRDNGSYDEYSIDAAMAEYSEQIENLLEGKSTILQFIFRTGGSAIEYHQVYAIVTSKYPVCGESINELAEEYFENPDNNGDLSYEDHVEGIMAESDLTWAFKDKIFPECTDIYTFWV